MAFRRLRRFIAFVACLAAPSIGVAVAVDQADPAVEQRRVALVRVPLPIVGSADTMIQARLQRAVDRIAGSDPSDRRPLLLLEFIPAPDGGATEFERALRLARFLVSEEMTRVKTLAYVPDSIEGHAVLVALACEEIAIAPDAQLGRAGADEDDSRPLEPGIRASYLQIAEARRTAPPAVVLAMVDRAAELVRVESDRGVEYALKEELDAFREDRVVVSEEVLAPSGTMAIFTGREARAEGVAKYLVADREALARTLAVPDAELLEDQSVNGEWKPVMVDLSGPVTARSVKRIETLIGDEIERNDINWVGVRIDSSGGSLSAALRLAQSLAELGEGEVRSVAYVPKRAEGPAALVALACDQLIMQQGALLVGEAAAEDVVEAPQPAREEGNDDPEANGEADNPAAGRPLGGVDRLPDEAELPDRSAELATVRQVLAPATTRTWSLLAASFDAALELTSYTNRETGAERVFSPEELEDQPEAGEWRRGETIKVAGKTLSLDADRAAEVGIAWQTVEQFDDLRTVYGFAESPRTAEPNWALELVEALASPGLAALLLVVGIVGLYIELNSPGLGIGGFIATVALLLFFWSKFLDGTADWLEVMLFVTGLVFILLELFVIPGFGIFGLGGALLVIGSLVLASQTFILPKTESQLVELRNSLATVAGAGFGFLLLAGVLRHYLPQSAAFRRMTLAPMEEADRIEQDRREQLADYEHLIGRSGTATTDLLPAGRAEIEGEPIDVLTRGEVIDQGEAIEVIEAHANRVIVRRVNG